ncbi:hypothetical protein ISCGN_019750 [Ixodes scapularis]
MHHCCRFAGTARMCAVRESIKFFVPHLRLCCGMLATDAPEEESGFQGPVDAEMLSRIAMQKCHDVCILSVHIYLDLHKKLGFSKTNFFCSSIFKAARLLNKPAGSLKPCFV